MQLLGIALWSWDIFFVGILWYNEDNRKKLKLPTIELNCSKRNYLGTRHSVTMHYVIYNFFAESNSGRLSVFIGFLVCKETVVLRWWESKTNISFYHTGWWGLSCHCGGLGGVTFWGLGLQLSLWGRAWTLQMSAFWVFHSGGSAFVGSFDETKFLSVFIDCSI